MKASMVSIILPTHNEEKAIGKVIDDINLNLAHSGLDFEIIVVDDASTDQSYFIAESRGVKIYRHANKKGSGASRKTGIINAKGDIIAMLDADGSYPTEYLCQMLKFIPEYDQIIAQRSSDYGNLKFLRIITKKFMFSLASILTGQRIPDLNSGLRIFKKNLIMDYLPLVANGFSCTSSMTLLFYCNGHSIKYFPINYCQRIGKSKFNIFKDTFLMLWTITSLNLRLNFYRRKRISSASLTHH